MGNVFAIFLLVVDFVSFSGTWCCLTNKQAILDMDCTFNHNKYSGILLSGAFIPSIQVKCAASIGRMVWKLEIACSHAMNCMRPVVGNKLGPKL